MILPIPHLSTICSPSTFRIPSAPPRSQNMPVSAAESAVVSFIGSISLNHRKANERSTDSGWSIFSLSIICLEIME